MMAERGVARYPVMREGRLAGIVSERDYARKVSDGRASADTPVRPDHERAGGHGRPEERVRRCMELMTAKRIRHLPVVDADGRMSAWCDAATSCAP